MVALPSTTTGPTLIRCIGSTRQADVVTRMKVSPTLLA
jgi:hypothetical protein